MRTKNAAKRVSKQILFPFEPEPPQGPPRKLSLSFPDEMVTWLKRDARKRTTTVSQVVREMCLPYFYARHQKP